MGQPVEQVQRHVAAVFQLAQVGGGDTHGLANLLQRVALLAADFPPFLAQELFGVVYLFPLLHKVLQARVAA